MLFRARHVAFVLALATAAPGAAAQVQWQPTPAPLVTAESTTWFQAGEPIEWNGDIYYPAGAAQGFNAYQMVRSGSYRGIPLYIDSTLEPNSIVFVPMSGGRMQPYERPRTGALAGTTGSRAPSLPTQVSTEMIGSGAVAQAPAPPTFAPPYEVATQPMPATYARPPQPASAPRLPETGAVGTSGRSPAVESPRPVTSVIPPTGANTIWINFAGERWYAAGKAIAYDASVLEEIGTYRGWTVYRRTGDPSIIYVPSLPGRLAAYKRR